jgi:DNA/RNA-binding domain of Phe-tRNA-synthetase-like protein
VLEVVNSLVQPDIMLGLLAASVESTRSDTSELDTALNAIVEDRRNGLGPRPEEVRLAVRDMLRFGGYRPTGRAKPASEYLLRAAASAEREFPRINYVVDVCNYISLKYLLPISLWDRDRAGGDLYQFRRGLPAEAYEFNASGQTIRLEDLAIGCVRSDVDDRLGSPIVSPIKDSQSTKTADGTRRIVAVVYAPGAVVDAVMLKTVCSEFARFIEPLTASKPVETAVCQPGGTCRLES